MAATSTYMASTHFSMLSWSTKGKNKQLKRRNFFSVSAQQAEVEELKLKKEEEKKEEEKQEEGAMKKPRPVEPQINVQSKNMTREHGGQWLSSATRHVRIYAAYIDPETFAFDQTQMDKLTLLLDPTDEFVWTDDTCTKVYSYFQELVDHYEVMKTSLHQYKLNHAITLVPNGLEIEMLTPITFYDLDQGAPLTEYTLRLIGSDIEHYIRKLLYNGEIQYNMNARVLNFSMGKPRVGFNYNGQMEDVNQ